MHFRFTLVFGLAYKFVQIVGASECTASETDGPIFVTPDCDDPLYHSPIIDSESEQQTPVQHQRVSGHFEGTEINFNIYLPPKTAWEGRFYQLVYPIQSAEADDDTITFGVESRAYTVQVNGTLGYRADASAAKFSRKVASAYYGSKVEDIYGYIYGGSGGSFQTIGAAENTKDVWQGAVALVQAVPASLPNNAACRALATFVLESKSNDIKDAVSPAGSGNPFAHLDGWEAEVLQEATLLGLPLATWENYTALEDVLTLRSFLSVIRASDPTYADDFWAKEGYGGTEKSELGDFFRAARMQFNTSISGALEGEPTGAGWKAVLDDSPNDEVATDLEFSIVATNGSVLGLLFGTVDDQTVTFRPESDPNLLRLLATGTVLCADNSWFLAVHQYHRHQIPIRKGFYGYDQFQDASGQPRYPQRQLLLAPSLAASSSGGGTHTGKINFKTIVVDNLLDYDAFPWHADWYQAQVQASLGESFQDNFRLWYLQAADHYFEPATKPKSSRIIQLMGPIRQALAHMADWAEGISEAPPTTKYKVIDSQIILEDFSSGYHGIQLTAQMTVNGSDKATCKSACDIVLQGFLEVALEEYDIDDVEWDIYGTGEWISEADSGSAGNGTFYYRASYDSPGIYFPGMRGTARRHGDSTLAFSQNIARARVVLE